MASMSTATYVTPMWWRNWFWPAYLARKRSRSGSPERKPARSSDSRRTLISIRGHQVAKGPVGAAGCLDSLEELLARIAGDDEARGKDDIGGQLLERLQVMQE